MTTDLNQLLRDFTHGIEELQNQRPAPRTENRFMMAFDVEQMRTIRTGLVTLSLRGVRMPVQKKPRYRVKAGSSRNTDRLPPIDLHSGPEWEYHMLLTSKLPMQVDGVEIRHVSMSDKNMDPNCRVYDFRDLL